MKRDKRLLALAFLLFFVFIVVYSVHFDYTLPLHIDEWNHIGDSMKLREGDYGMGTSSLELGFHFFLMCISFFFDLVLVYHLLPAIWASISAIVLFIIVQKENKREKEAAILGILTVIFFASIKSNVNLLGLWFFTPLTFSIPIIFLFIFWLKKGIEEDDFFYLGISLLSCLVLIVTHAISFLAFVPAIFIYLILRRQKLNKKVFIFLIIVPVAFVFYMNVLDLAPKEAISDILSRVVFERGWGVLELDNSFLELYSFIGYLLAFIGMAEMYFDKKKRESGIIYFLIVITLLISIVFFRITGLSVLSPYQRNMYYLVIFLPYFSARGTMVLLRKINDKDRFFYQKKKNLLKRSCKILVVLLIIFFSFYSYMDVRSDAKIYKLITNEDYEALEYLDSLEKKGKVMADPKKSCAVYPISQNPVVATLFFHGKRERVHEFLREKRCEEKRKIAEEEKVEYVFSENKIDCGWRMIYSRNKRYIYET